MITDLFLDRLEVPLSEPYRLSTVTIESFDIVLVRVRKDDGSLGFGEVTSLEGYSDENADQVWENLRTVGITLPGTSADQAVSHAASELDGYPFSATGLISAIETAGEYEWPTATTPIVAICSADDPPAVRRQSLTSQLNSGFDTVKIKVGFDPTADAEAVTQFVETAPDDISFRVDANQGYSLAEARKFLTLTPTDRIDHLEQPLPVGRLDDHATLTAETDLDIILDEEVTTADDLAAVDDVTAADGVKFKLMKCGGLNRAQQLLEDATERGFTVIFGNGVQSDIGCLLEAAVSKTIGLDTAGEFNGWRKQSESVLQSAPEFSDGCLCWDGSVPELNETAVERYRSDMSRFGVE